MKRAQSIPLDDFIKRNGHHITINTNKIRAGYNKNKAIIEWEKIQA